MIVTLAPACHDACSGLLFSAVRSGDVLCFFFCILRADIFRIHHPQSTRFPPKVDTLEPKKERKKK
jgi:hypothetical protein